VRDYNDSLVAADITEKAEKKHGSKVSLKLATRGTGNGKIRITYRPNSLTFIQSVATRVRFRTEKRVLM